MKIALCIENAFSYAGTENICSFMCGIYSENNIVDILSLKGSGETFYPYPGARNVYSVTNSNLSRRDLLKKIESERYDFVFIIGMGRLSVEFAILARIFLGKSTRKITKFIACEHVSFQSFSRIKKIIKVISLQFYDKVVVLTERDKINLSQHHNQVVKIPNPVFYKNYKPNNNSRIAIAVGRLNQQKGFDRLIKIWREFSSKNSEWKLFLIGSGELEQELKRQATDLIEKGKLTFTGKRNHLDAFYKTAAILLMTSHYEGLPLVLLEAKSWSLPAIAYDCPTGPSEIICDGVDGFLIPNDDQEKFIERLNMIVESPDILHQLRDNISTTHRKFDPEQIKTLWMQLITD